MYKLIIVAAVVLLSVLFGFASAKYGGPNGLPGPYENYDSGHGTVAAGDSLVFAADTHWRITFVYLSGLGGVGSENITVRMLKREPYLTGAVASTDEQFVAYLAGAPKQPYHFYAVADTVILRGEAAAETKFAYFIGQSHYGSRLVGSAP